jgi:hypothetical protein
MDNQSRKSKDRQYNGQKKKDKKTNNYLQNITQNTKDRPTRTPLKTGEFRCSGRVNMLHPSCGCKHGDVINEEKIG